MCSILFLDRYNSNNHDFSRFHWFTTILNCITRARVFTKQLYLKKLYSFRANLSPNSVSATLVIFVDYKGLRQLIFINISARHLTVVFPIVIKFPPYLTQFLNFTIKHFAFRFTLRIDGTNTYLKLTLSCSQNQKNILLDEHYNCKMKIETKDWNLIRTLTLIWNNLRHQVLGQRSVSF